MPATQTSMWTTQTTTKHSNQHSNDPAYEGYIQEAMHYSTTLCTLAIALSLFDKGTNAALMSRVNEHFKSSPELQTNPRFSGLSGCKGSSGHQNTREDRQELRLIHARAGPGTCSESSEPTFQDVMDVIGCVTDRKVGVADKGRSVKAKIGPSAIPGTVHFGLVNFWPSEGSRIFFSDVGSLSDIHSVKSDGPLAGPGHMDSKSADRFAINVTSTKHTSAQLTAIFYFVSPDMYAYAYMGRHKCAVAFTPPHFDCVNWLLRCQPVNVDSRQTGKPKPGVTHCLLRRAGGDRINRTRLPILIKTITLVRTDVVVPQAQDGYINTSSNLLGVTVGCTTLWGWCLCLCSAQILPLGLQFEISLEAESDH
ncbi:hypothetical protein BJV74DRAFT_986443 [Russula compacta]|nr:hypothetical protein BJV74DRAFT_986443 [Russula compacta]